MRISMFLWDPLMRQIFTNNIRTYSDTLKRCGFQEKPAFIPETPCNPNANERRKNRCKIICFNSPYSINVKTNIGKVFLNILDKHSPVPPPSPPPPFNNNIRTYSDALKRCGFQEKPAFIPETPFSPNANERRKNRCKIIWFNPPYSINVKTNIDKVLYYLNILDKDSPLITSPPPPLRTYFTKVLIKTRLR